MRNSFLFCLLFCACANTVPPTQVVIENRVSAGETSTLERNVKATVVIYFLYYNTSISEMETEATMGVVINDRHVLMRSPQFIAEKWDWADLYEIRIGRPGMDFSHAPWRANVTLANEFLTLAKTSEIISLPSVVITAITPKEEEMLYAVSAPTEYDDDRLHVSGAAYVTRAMVLSESARNSGFHQHQKTRSPEYDLMIAFENVLNVGKLDSTTGMAGIFNKKHEMIGLGSTHWNVFSLGSDKQKRFFNELYQTRGNFVPSCELSVVPFLQEAGISYASVN